MKKTRLCMALFMVLNICMSALAQDIDIKKHPGYINIEDIKIPDREGMMTDISLGPAFLRIAKDVTEDEGGHLANFISGISSVRVKAFDVDLEESEDIREIMDRFEERMNQEKWERLVRVKSEDERLDIRIKFDEGKAVGLFLMALDPGDEAAFINVVGDNIDFKHVGFLRKGFFGFDCDWF